jgi:hypothetical protein
MTETDFEQRVQDFARRLFEKGLCPACLVLWGKPLACGEGLGHEGNHVYNQAVQAEADLS